MSVFRKSLLVSLAFAWALLSSATAQDVAKPEDAGFSSDRLGRITQWLRDDIAKGTIPGAVLMIVRHGKVAYFESLGVVDPETKAPMRKDAIFRIYFDEQADYHDRRHDAVRAGQAHARRTDRKIHPAVQGHESRGRDQGH